MQIELGEWYSFPLRIDKQSSNINPRLQLHILTMSRSLLSGRMLPEGFQRGYLMNNDQDKKIKAARQSLDDMLELIEPYTPKKPEVKKKEVKTWQIMDSNVLPPLNSLGCK